MINAGERMASNAGGKPGVLVESSLIPYTHFSVFL
jgi:hypothetical protein